MTLRCLLLAVATLLLFGCSGDSAGNVVLDDLSQPRGLTVQDSTVCIAEAGAIGPDGPDRELPGQLESDSGRLICAPLSGGEVEVPLDQLPFVYYPDAAVTSGVTDVTGDGDRLFALIGESYGDLSRSIVEVDESGPRVVADLLSFAEANALADDGVRSNPFSFVLAVDDRTFYVAEAAAGTVLRAGTDGSVETFATVPGHEVLTGMTMGPDGDLYVASFGQLPHPQGSGAVVAIDSEGNHRVVLEDLSMAIDVGFDSSGGMFVLEYSTPPDDPSGVDAYRDDAGRLLYLPPDAQPPRPSVLLHGLDRPTALAIATNTVVISVSGDEKEAGAGSVVRYEISTLLDEEQP